MSNSDFHYDGFSAPNYTQVPDDVFDVLAPQLSEAELRVLLYIIRRTFGFKKQADSISLKQLVEGIRTHDGRVLDSGAGVAKSSAVRAVKGLVEKGIVAAQRNQSRERGFEATTYALRFKSDPLSHHETRGASSPVKQALVSPRNIQETVLQETDVEISKFERPTHEFVGDGEDTGPMGAAAEPSAVAEPSAQAIGHAPPQTAPTNDPGTELDRLEEPSATSPAYERFKDQALTHRTGMATAMEKIAGRRRTRDPDRLPRRAATAPEPAMTPVAAVLPTKGRPPGSGEERDRIAAYLTDFARELNDQAPLASSVTRALRAFQQAKAPRERWGDYLYQARSITQEHSAQIKTKAQGSGFGPKPKMAYYFAVLEDLLGLKPDAIARPPTPGQGP